MSESSETTGRGVRIEQVLERSWWAVDCPTAGYLFSMGLQVAWLVPGLTGSPPRRADLHVLTAPMPGEVDLEVDLLAGPTGIRLMSLTFVQDRPVARVQLYFSDNIHAGPTRPSDAVPDVLPPECYSDMRFEAAAPPVTSRFEYRPTLPVDGTSARPGWDLVWVRHRVAPISDAVRALSMVDCWYPPLHMAEVARFLAGQTEEARQPAPTSLLGASLLFPSPDRAYTYDGFILLATRLEAMAAGHQYEHCELWSERGDLLIAGHVLRSDHRSLASRDASAEHGIEA